MGTVAGRKQLIEAAWEEIRGSVPGLEAVPLGERVLVYPVEVDYGGLIERVHLKKEMPDLGLVLAVSWGVNEAIVERLMGMVRSEETLAEDLRAVAAYEVGDVVMLNRFSGMAVPETEAVAIHKDDIIMKFRGLPVRLRRTDQRPELAVGDDGTLSRAQRRRAEREGRIVAPS